jgi:photosystem II stability/assembly factor-like uncharacterized protein
VAASAAAAVVVAAGAALTLASHESTSDHPLPGATRVVGDPVPEGFQASDLSWVSVDAGFAVGIAPCGTASCTHVLRTVDGGASWWDAGATGLPHGCAAACPTRVRFADQQTGYVFGNGLLMTTDGGTTWSRQPGPDTFGLEVSGGTAVRVLAREACPGCRFEVQRSGVGSSAWESVRTSDEPRSVAALARQLEHVVVALKANPAGGAGDAHTSVLLSNDGGTTWTRQDDPCQGPGDNDPEEVDAAQLDWSLDAELLVLCQRRAWRSNGGNSTVLVSTDAGGNFAPPTGFPEATDAFLVAGGQRGVLLAETHQGNDKEVALLRSADSGRTWVEVARAPLPDGATEMHYLAFSTPLVATWVPPGGTTVLRTTDGGTSWTETRFSGAT